MTTAKEKLKIEIEKLKTEIERLRFEYSELGHWYLGALAILVAVFIPIITSMGKLTLLLITSGIFLFLVFAITLIERIVNKKKAKDIDCAYCKLNSLYEQLLK